MNKVQVEYKYKIGSLIFYEGRLWRLAVITADIMLRHTNIKYFFTSEDDKKMTTLELYEQDIDNNSKIKVISNGDKRMTAKVYNDYLNDLTTRRKRISC